MKELLKIFFRLFNDYRVDFCATENPKPMFSEDLFPILKGWTPHIR
jgi:hypothetical protein